MDGVAGANRLTSLLKTDRFDVVATHANWPHAVFAQAVRQANLPLVNFVHDALRSPTWIDKLAARSNPDLVIANSNFSAQFVPNVFEEVPTKVVYLPVESRWKEIGPGVRVRIRSELDTPLDSNVIIQVSRLETLKGAQLTLAALGALKQGAKNWTAWIVGGAQRPEEQAFANQLKLLASTLGIADRVRFLGQRTDVPELLSAADIFCQPNIAPDALGITFIEALQAGLPVVTSNMGGGAEIVNNSCGRLVSPGSVSQLSDALINLAEPSNRPSPLNCRDRAYQLCDASSQLLAYHSTLVETVGMTHNRMSSA